MKHRSQERELREAEPLKRDRYWIMHLKTGNSTLQSSSRHDNARYQEHAADTLPTAGALA
jgi:hypothetical protein